ALVRGFEQALMGVLAMDIHQLFAQLAQLGQRDRYAANIGAAASLTVDGAAQDQVVVGVEVVFGQPSSKAVRSVEYGTDVGPGRAFANKACIAASAQCQRERVDQDGFARSGFTREYGEPRVKRYFGLVDNHKIADVQGTQHDELFDFVRRLGH